MYLSCDDIYLTFAEGFSMEIYIATEGRVLPYILDPNFENYLPVIPPEVTYSYKKYMVKAKLFFRRLVT